MTVDTSIPDFDSMTIEEIEAWNKGIKEQITSLQDLYRQSNELLHRKVNQLHHDMAVSEMQKLADASGRSLTDEAEFWQGRLTTGNGTTPDPGRWIQSNIVLGKDNMEGVPQ